MKRTRRLNLSALSVLIMGLMVVQTGIAGQSAAGLVIQVLDANEGENLIEKELPPTKVRVMDRTGRVIPGANVQFQAPEDGPTGLFMPNSSQITVTTDAQGMATAPRFRTNSRVGDYQIQVVASYRDSVSRASIPQTNVYKVKSSSRKYFILSAMIGGVAAAAFASRGGNSGPVSSALDALTVTPTITIGGGSPIGVSTPALMTASPASAPAPASTTTTAVTPTPTSTTTSGVTFLPSPTTSTSTATVPSGGTVQPSDPVPVVLSPCAGMPVNSNKRDCR